jgi:hypothetical protein
MKQKTIKKIRIIAILLLSAGTLNAVAPRQWGITNGGTHYSTPSDKDAVILPSGNVIAISSIDGVTPPLFLSDIRITKFDANGVEIGTYTKDFWGQNQDDLPKRIILSGSFIYVMGTAHYNNGVSQDLDIFILKLDTSLAFQGSNFFNGTNGAANADDQGVDMGKDNAGNIYVTGTTVRAASGTDIVMLKYNSSLSPLFTKYNTSAGNAVDVPVALKVGGLGTCYLAATKSSATLGTRISASKWASNLTKIWEAYHDAKAGAAFNDEASGVSFDPATDDIYVTGRGEFTSGDFDWTVARFDGAAGTKLWAKRYAGTLSGITDKGADISFFNSGALYVCGSLYNLVSGVSATHILTKKLDPATGTTTWSRSFAGPTNENDNAAAILVTPGENIYTIGSSERGMFGTQSYFIALKYNASGTSVWKDSLYFILNGACNNHSTFGLRAVYNSTLQTLIGIGHYDECTTSFRNILVLAKYAPTSFSLKQDGKNPESASGSFDNISVYPNPVNSEFTISNDEEITAVNITDLTGRIVYSSAPAERVINVNSSAWPAGIYTVIIYCGSVKTYRKIVKN